MAELDLTEAIEAAALAIAETIDPYTGHSQKCPVWSHKAAVSACDCWAFERARRYAQIALGIGKPILERQVRERVAQEIEAYQPSAHMVVCPPHIAWEAGRETSAWIARGGRP